MVYFQMLGSSKSCISSRAQFKVEIVYHYHTLFEDGNVFSIGPPIASFQAQSRLSKVKPSSIVARASVPVGLQSRTAESSLGTRNKLSTWWPKLHQLQSDLYMGCRMYTPLWGVQKAFLMF